MDFKSFVRHLRWMEKWNQIFLWLVTYDRLDSCQCQIFSVSSLLQCSSYLQAYFLFAMVQAAALLFHTIKGC